jgi:hypothetical protein
LPELRKDGVSPRTLRRRVARDLGEGRIHREDTGLRIGDHNALAAALEHVPCQTQLARLLLEGPGVGVECFVVGTEESAHPARKEQRGGQGDPDGDRHDHQQIGKAG